MIIRSVFFFLSLIFLCLFSLVPVNSTNTSKSADGAGWSSIKVALVQYPVVGGLTLEELTRKVYKYVEASSTDEADLVVFPELFSLDLLDWSIPETEQFEDIIAQIFPDFIAALEKMADSFELYILAGSVPAMVNGKIRNRSYLIGPGHQSVFQEKMFLTPDEVEWGWEASNVASVINTPWGKTAITICYDSEIPLVSQTLSQDDIDVLLIPSMTGDSGFTRVRWSVQARSVEHLSYALVTGCIGDPAPGWGMRGQGAVLGPSLDGYSTPPLIAEGTLNKDEIVYATLDLDELRRAKISGDYYPAQNERNRTLTVQYLQL